jgi:endonuclease/exonuclease/phosphatase family metal-dependent hydrolase
MRQDCDVWLLTEVHLQVAIPGMKGHRTNALMSPPKAWAAIFSKGDATIDPDPHRATAVARIDGFRFMSSVLPWRSCGPSWEGKTLAEKLSATLAVLEKYVDETTVWGGDWNQALEGPEYVGSLDGRRQIVELTQKAALSVPTRTLASASRGHRAIDHVAVPMEWDVTAACRIAAEASGRRLSDHDAYVISVDP